MVGGRLRVLMLACSCGLLAGVAGGCGEGTLTITETTTATMTATVTQTVTRTVTVHAPSQATSANAAATTPTSPTPSPSTGQPANTLRVHDASGNALLVTVNGVTPATPAAAGFAPAAGDRLVALSLTLTGVGPATVTGDANTDATLTGTDGHTYATNFDAVSQCANFNRGVYTLGNGATASGCVVFQLPVDVSDQSVQFSLGDGTVQFNKS